MPITSIALYGPITEAFNINWTQADLELGTAGPLKLAEGYSRLQFNTDRQAVLDAIENVQAKRDEARTAAMARDNAKVQLLTRGKQFRNSVLAQITDNTYTNNLPKLARETAELSKFSEPLQAMERLWARINTNASVWDWEAR
jgi:hypothetical protein